MTRIEKLSLFHIDKSINEIDLIHFSTHISLKFHIRRQYTYHHKHNMYYNDFK